MKLIKSISAIIISLMSIYCYKLINDMNIIPNKYLYIFLGLLITLNILGLIFMLLKKKIFSIFSIIIYLLIFIISILGIWYSSNTINYLDKSFSNNNVEVRQYNVLVLKKSEYKKIDDLISKKIGYVSIEGSTNDYLSSLKNRIEADYQKENINKLYNDFMNKKISAIVIENSYLDMLEEEFNNFKSSTRIIYSYDIENKNKSVSREVKELSSFNVYISGSDSRSNSVVANSRSDVNMIASINPDTNTILLTSIPRDYYVQLHGTSGIKDKLTHAGIYGVDMSRETLEDLFNIKIDYSIKVSMSSIVKLVDLIDGIDIYSDTTFNSYHIKGWTVNKGMNHMNGNQALAYARERYAYSNGDVHRVQNQQQVLAAVLEKVMNDKSILLKYDSLLNSFSDLYRTDIPKDLIALLVKNQLNNMKSIKVERQYVDGVGSMSETYSMPGVKLYVMNPNMSSVILASNRINTVINNS